jgi:hypothetical protein
MSADSRLCAILTDVLQLSWQRADLASQISDDMKALVDQLQAIPAAVSPQLPPIQLHTKTEKWQYEGTESYRKIVDKFGDNMRHQDLLAIANGIENRLPPGAKIGRDQKRKKDLLLKWFDEHWQHIQPLLEFVVLIEKS